MFIAVYRFKIKPATKEAFIQAWKTHMEGIYLVLGSLGSRLHKEEKTGDYIVMLNDQTKHIEKMPTLTTSIQKNI
ncbi:hypothetical protein [Acinetobacter sp. NPDC052428]|uniref:hypothetical protein n=1 Tax=Acinetobacter sp. NPDC052428 TaxID=3363890 RepID=UPI0037C9342A